MSTLPSPAVELHQVSLAYGPLKVLRDLDWTLYPGQVVGLLGRNGAGKTTLLESMLGLREPEKGSVTVYGQAATRLDDDCRARIGYVPQQSDLFESFTSAQLLAYFRSFYPRWDEAKVNSLMSRWDIPFDKPIARMSGGQKQRLSIIRALAHQPDLLVLDEPVASLDPAGRRDFLRELVDQVLDRGTTVVLSTHILSDLERVAFNVAFMRDGRICLQAPLDELLEQTRQVSGTGRAINEFIHRSGAELIGKPVTGGAAIESALLRLAPETSMDGSGLNFDAVNLEALFMELA